MATKNDQDRKRYFSDDFQFNNRGQVTKALRHLSHEQAKDFVLSMMQKNQSAFFYHLNTSQQVRSIVFNSLPTFAPDGIFATLEISRKVVNNPCISDRSSKVFGVCGYTANQMFDFIKEQCFRLYSNQEDLGRAKFLVVIDCAVMGKIVCKYLNTLGYAIYQTDAPRSSARWYMREHLNNFPVFLVTQDVFTGPVVGRLSAAFVFKRNADYPSAWVLEGALARELCTTSFSIFPKNDQGIVNMVDHYRDVSCMLPLRV